MRPLIRVLFDITLLRKGPEDIPYSWLLLNFCVGFWLIALGATTVMIQGFNALDAWIAIASAFISITCFAALLLFFGRAERVVQTLSAMIGCGSLISIAMLVELVLMTPFVGANIANLGAIIVLFWSVPVKGHIIARAMDWHWYPGIVLAMAVFVLQFAFTTTISPES